jgi:hypothetical protein
MRDTEVIYAFLQLPPEAYPTAEWVAPHQHLGAAWPEIQARLRGEGTSAADGLQVRLWAARPGWREGVIVML